MLFNCIYSTSKGKLFCTGVQRALKSPVSLLNVNKSNQLFLQTFKNAKWMYSVFYIWWVKRCFVQLLKSFM